SDFLMNDKCAAGTGRFLEMVAMRLDIPCSELSNLASQSSNDIRLNSTCVVFAESEIIGLISQNISSADIARAVHLSVCDRVVSQVNQMKWENPVVFTGGVALNSDIKRVLSDILKTDIITPPEPELTGAIGAMLVALNDYEQS
ncbi:MAG: 2-hydroxyglutaryl-CoA dehydratase, partial [Candidatus Cloacimonetes bacterium]|nr:2-hydroxyglutaryl-CoA dehydratase [Candidatus Cloacimonadota bacterium]